jgi:nucleoid DNA-binding protein
MYKKAKDNIPKVAQQLNMSEEKVADIVDFFYTETRAELESLKHTAVRLPGLGVFKAKPLIIKENIETLEYFEKNMHNFTFKEAKRYSKYVADKDLVKEFYNKILTMKAKNSLKRIWRHKAEILEGLKNNIFKSESVETIARERSKICINCSFYDIEGTKCAVPGTAPCCGSCGCSLALKLRSLSSDCPTGKWDAVLSVEEEDKLEEIKTKQND